MRVIDIQSAVLSDEEVLRHCVEVRARNEQNKEFTFAREIKKEDGSQVRRLDGKLRELNWITGDIIKHFSNQDSPLSNIAKEAETAKPQHQRREAYGIAVDGEEAPGQTKQLLLRLKPFGLTKSELLMLTNHRPRSEAVLDVLIEECETRFDADQQAKILKVVREVYDLPDPEAEEEEQTAEEAMEGVEKG